MLRILLVSFLSSFLTPSHSLVSWYGSGGLIDSRCLSTGVLDQESVDELTPWYPLFRDVILHSRPISEHETFNHPTCRTLSSPSPP